MDCRQMVFLLALIVLMVVAPLFPDWLKNTSMNPLQSHWQVFLLLQVGDFGGVNVAEVVL